MPDRYEPDDLQLLIIEARRAYLYLDRGPARIHTDHTSLIDDVNTADEGGLGPPFTVDMHRYLRSHIKPRDGETLRDIRPRITERPGMASIYEVADWCKAQHSTHFGRGFRDSLCAQIVFEVVVLGQEPDDVTWSRGWTDERTRDALTKALLHANRWRRRELDRLSREWGIGAPEKEPKPFAA